MLRTALIVAAVVSAAASHAGHDHDNAWLKRYGPSVDLSFSGVNTFAHLPHHRCLDNSLRFDVAVVGVPFDTSVSFRPGARFGPFAIRSGSRRHTSFRGYNIPWGFNPWTAGAEIVDCGDVPASPYDNELAIEQIEVAYSTLLERPVATDWAENHGGMKKLAKDKKEHPRIITLGGDHTIVLPILRSLHKVYGPISVVHFDSHLDTWPGDQYVGAITPQSQITHGSFFWKASTEGLLANTSSIHAGIRTRLAGFDDLTHDASVGFQIITTDDIEDMRVSGIIKAIRDRVGSTPVYLSFDIDTIDPSMAPGTGTPESGGWTMREAKAILRGLAGLNVVGADIVEVSPAYDGTAELTGFAAADLVQEYMGILFNEGAKVEPAVKGLQLNHGASNKKVVADASTTRDEL